MIVKTSRRFVSSSIIYYCDCLVGPRRPRPGTWAESGQRSDPLQVAGTGAGTAEGGTAAGSTAGTGGTGGSAAAGTAGTRTGGSTAAGGSTVCWRGRKGSCRGGRTLLGAYVVTLMFVCR